MWRAASSSNWSIDISASVVEGDRGVVAHDGPRDGCDGDTARTHPPAGGLATPDVRRPAGWGGRPARSRLLADRITTPPRRAGRTPQPRAAPPEDTRTRFVMHRLVLFVLPLIALLGLSLTGTADAA